MNEVEAVEVEFPPAWTHVQASDSAIIELSRSTIAAMDAEGLRVTPVDRRRIEATFGRLRSAVRLSGLSSLGLFVDFLPAKEAISDSVVEVLYATCSIRNLSKKDLETELPLAPEVLMAALAKSKTPDGLLNERHSYTALEAPAVVEIPAGRALLLRELFEYRRNLADLTKMFSQTYLLPQDRSFETLTVMQMSTPNIRLAREFSGVFHGIARSLSFIKASDPRLVEGETLSGKT